MTSGEHLTDLALHGPPPTLLSNSSNDEDPWAAETSISALSGTAITVAGRTRGHHARRRVSSAGCPGPRRGAARGQ
jgi:hypothetical protein